jgi:hypothetical protein
MPDHNHNNYIPLIFVGSIYSPKEGEVFRKFLKQLRAEKEIGVGKLANEIKETVSFNRQRIRKPNGSIGLFVDQLSERNLRHFLSGKRSHDARMQILDAFCQIYQEKPSASRLMI